MKSLSKKGSGHFEMIIAFTLFVGFTFFLFMMLDPQDDSSLFGSVIIGVENNFNEITSVSLGQVFLKVNYTRNESCFYLDFPSDIFVLNFNNPGSLVFDLSGNEVDSIFAGGKLSIESGEEFFRVSISEEFDNDVLGSCDVADSYDVGVALERKVISYSKLVEMKDKYFADYEGLREDLKVPGIFDFAIVPQNFPEVVMLPVTGIPDSVDVLSEEKVFDILNENGTLISERISFRIW